MVVDYFFIKFGLTGELVMSKIHLKKNEKPQVQLVRPFFFFGKQKFKNRNFFREFFKKGQKLKNGYFLDLKSAKIS